MRVNKREQILDAIVEIIQRDGVTAVTFDAVAEETGLTRGGLLYHFPSRDDLILATHRHLADQWDHDMSSTVGKTASETAPVERHTAYVQACSEAAKRVELLLMLESAGDPKLGLLWQDVMDRWAPPAPENEDAAALSAFIARLAADGLWIHEALSSRPLSAGLKKRICDKLIAMVDERASGAAGP